MPEKEPEVKVELVEKSKAAGKEESWLIISQGETFLRLMMKPRGKNLYIFQFDGHKPIKFLNKLAVGLWRIDGGNIFLEPDDFIGRPHTKLLDKVAAVKWLDDVVLSLG